MTTTPRDEIILTKQQKIAELSRQSPEMAWTTLAHHIDLEWLEAAWRRTRKDGAAGVDGVKNRHLPVALQRQVLARKLKGHCAYYGITGNAKALSRFRCALQRGWRKWLGRRSHAGRMSWEIFQRLSERYPLSPVRVVHSVCVT